jgi:hypothetical protein
MVRSKETEAAIDLLSQLRDNITPQAAEWFVEVLCVREIRKELLIDCPLVETRKFLLVLAKAAIERARLESREKLLCYLLHDLDLATLKHGSAFA